MNRNSLHIHVVVATAITLFHSCVISCGHLAQYTQERQTSYSFNIMLTKCSGPGTIRRIKTLNVDENDWYIYEDDHITIMWAYRPVKIFTSTFEHVPVQHKKAKGLVFRLLNKTDQTVGILWNSVLYTDQNAEKHRVIHTTNMEQTDIETKAHISDLIYPIGYTKRRGWRLEPVPLFTADNAHAGQSISISMPIHNIPYTYLFTFKILVTE